MSNTTEIMTHEASLNYTGSEAKDVTTPEVSRTPRNRKPPAKKTVTCHACGKTFKVNANMVYGEYYRCDNCTGR